MRKIPKLRVLSMIILAVALVAALAVPVLAQPVTSPVQGSVTINGTPAPVGTQVQVFVGTELTARAAVTTTIVGEYELMIVGEAVDVGKDLTFKVGGQTAVPTPASPKFASYAPQNIDLAVGGVTPVAPTVMTVAASSIGQTTARTNGNLTSLGTAATVSVYFKYGTSAAVPNATAMMSRTSTGAFYLDWTGLSPQTTYYFQAVAQGDGTAYGSILSFTTLADGVPPDGEHPPAGTFASWLYETFVEPLEG
jgi:hypothetical protein